MDIFCTVHQQLFNTVLPVARMNWYCIHVRICMYTYIPVRYILVLVVVHCTAQLYCTVQCTIHEEAEELGDADYVGVVVDDWKVGK